MSGLTAVSITTPAQALDPHSVLHLGVPQTALAGQQFWAQIGWFSGDRPVDGVVEIQRQSGGAWIRVAQTRVANGYGAIKISSSPSTAWRAVAKSVTKPAGLKLIGQLATSAACFISQVTDPRQASAPLLQAAPYALNAGGSGRLSISWFSGDKPVTGTVSLWQTDSSGAWVRVGYLPVTKGWATWYYTANQSRYFRVDITGSSSPAGLPNSGPPKYSGVVLVGVAPAATPPKPVIPASFNLTGSGWGHGVGMSQYGAQAQAIAGRNVSQILSSYYTGTKISRTELGRDVRVQVSSSTAGTTATFLTAGGQVSAGGVVAQVAKGEKVRLATSGGRLVVTLLTSSGAVKQTVASAATTATLTWDGTRARNPNGATGTVSLVGAHGTYRHGTLQASVIGGKVNVVNVLRLVDEYLYGVAEVPSSWKAAALQAQVIAARTYATNNGAYKSSCDCNLYSTTASQYFTGWNKENETVGSVRWGSYWKAAVDATRAGTKGDILVTTAGGPVQAFYFAASGGRTENNNDIWGGTALPYTRSVADAWSLDTKSGNANISWTFKLTQAEAARIFGLPNVVSLTINSRTAGGSVASITAASQAGAKATITGPETIRIRLGLKSSWVSAIKVG